MGARFLHQRRSCLSSSGLICIPRFGLQIRLCEKEHAEDECDRTRPGNNGDEHRVSYTQLSRTAVGFSA